MHSVKNSSSKFSSPNKYEPQSVKNRNSKTMNLDTLSTESQQNRIKKAISSSKSALIGANSIVITQSDLVRMKNSSLIVTKEELFARKKQLEEEAEKRHALAEAKKKMMAELEAERKKGMPPSEAEAELQAKNEALMARAKQIMNEDRDEVKEMNKMMLYAKVVTIRDNQLTEKKEIEKERRKEEKMKDLMMEIDRLQKIKYYEGVENVKKDNMRKAAMETITQVKDREWERMKAQDEVEREGQEMLKRLKQMQREEQAAALVKKQKQKELLDEIAEANHQAILKKQEKVLKEREEEEKIVQYNRDKAQKEAEYQAELKRIKDQKERDIQKLRELQEKFSDRQSEIDALRAKRAAELADRQARDKERKEAEWRAKINQDLLEARRLQHAEKEMRLQEQAKQERDEFDRIIAAQRADRDNEIRAENNRHEKLRMHHDQLKGQIINGEEKKKQAKREYLEEGRKIKDNLKTEKQLLELIKQNKIEELNEMGINPKYQAELARKRIMI